MGELSSGLQRKINSATDLKSVVRTMKAMAAANISQYETAVSALDDYYITVQLGLVAYFHSNQINSKAVNYSTVNKTTSLGKVGFIAIGSDQGLVGKFNDALVSHLLNTMKSLPGEKRVWAIGERIQTHLSSLKIPLEQPFALPNSINAVTGLVTSLLQEIEALQQTNELCALHIVFNRSLPNAKYETCTQKVLPLDSEWQQKLTVTRWPSRCLPQLLTDTKRTFSALIGEYLFTTLYKACTESLASENASRLTAMQRAEKNIEELQTELSRQFHRQRQQGIDEELSDLVSGFEALSFKPSVKARP
ncbi:F0F1 ATP synthase subunit gamma [uncultured Alteromonas sp.]|uniref:F0F1 ATP synthase subunit gamma n=1 Tax=uncultured Alteromonas sp. TaxID=179113 RepID=UPI0030CF0A54|tara:strand:- start:6666 stop:7583 length:918 start_codon:yes stop_codon:yes gene_type:complete